MNIRGLLERLKNYDGIEDELEVILSNNEEELHIWEGYFSAIFDNAPLEGKWRGFTRDYQEDKGAYGSEGRVFLIDVEEYLEDMLQYEQCVFTQDTREVYESIKSLLIQSRDKHQGVKMVVN